MARKLTESMEDYLEAIAELIALNGHAHTKEIAEKLNVKMPSVSGALRQLVQAGYIHYNTHYPVQLTPTGKEIADEVVRRHAVLKKFFVDILGLSPEKASETACRLEHAVDEETVARFTLFSEAIELRSDAKSLQAYLSEAIAFSGQDATYRVLSQLPCGAGGTVALIGRNIDAEKIPVPLHAAIQLKNISLDKTVFTVSIDGGAEVSLPVTAAENLWIRLA